MDSADQNVVQMCPELTKLLASWVWNRILQREFKKSFIKVRREPNEIVNVDQILWGTKEVFHKFLGGVIEVTDLECGH